MFIFLLACGSTEVPPPQTETRAPTPEPVNTAPPKVDAPPPQRPQANLKKDKTHCQPTEYTVFSCLTEAGSKQSPKILSVCAQLEGQDSDWIQYRFGKVDNIELSYPSETKGSLALFTIEETRWARSMGHSLHFSNDNADYSVSSRYGSSHPGEAEHNNFEGVELTTSTTAVQIRCTEEAVNNLETMNKWLASTD